MSGFYLVLSKEKYFLIFLFILSFALRAAFFSVLIKDKKYWVCKDSTEYHVVADQIAQGNGISNENGQPTFFRVPGYSIFLASFYKIFNFDVVKTLWVQVFLSSLIPILVFFLALVLFPSNFLLAKSSSVFVAFSIGSILNSALLMSDALFVLFFLVFVILFFSSFSLLFDKNEKRFSWQKLFGAGIFLGIASLIRPVGQYIIFVAVIFLILSNFALEKKIKSIIFLFCGWVLIVLGWLFRNWLLTGVIFFHSMPGVHFLTYLACEVDSQANQCMYSESKYKLFKTWDGLIYEFEQKNEMQISEIEKCDLAFRVAHETFKKYPLITIKHCLMNCFKTCFSLHSSFILFLFAQSWPNYSGTTSLWEKVKHYLFLNTPSIWFQFLVYYEILFLLILIIGFCGCLIFSLFKRSLWDSLFKCVVIILLFIFLTCGSGVARLRLPIEPMMGIFSLYFWLYVFMENR